MNSIQTILNAASQKLLASGSPSARLDAKLLLLHVLKQSLNQHESNITDIDLIIHAHKHIDTDSISKFQYLIDLRCEGRPVAHLIGKKEFWSLDFEINEHTLIPRPDTESLVETCLTLIKIHHFNRVLDLGTGSGIIAITLAKEVPNLTVLAVDNSENALLVARRNAQKHHCHDIEFIKSDWFSSLDKNIRFDLIVSNPPYIDEKDVHLEKGDVRFEPVSALVAENNGMKDIDKIMQQAKLCLKDNGVLIFEHGYNQRQAVEELFKKYSYHNIKQIQDYAGNDRVNWAWK